MRRLLIATAVFMAACFAVRAAETAEDLLKEAQQAESSGNFQKPAQLYTSFLKKYPSHSQATFVHYSLAKCYDNMGMVDETIAELKKVVEGPKEFKNRSDAYFMLGKTHGSMKQYDEAIAVFEKMLAEGAGLHEDEVLNLCGGYYAVKEKYDEAAAKFNILKRKDSNLAESAAYKLVILFLNSRKLDMAMSSLQDLAQRFPKSKQLPDLMLKLADSFRAQKKYDATISLCEQIKTSFPKTVEEMAASYVLGLCYRDRKDFQKAVQVFDQVGKLKDMKSKALAAEALRAAADIYYSELNDMPKAIHYFNEAAVLARDSESERKKEILEECYFRLAEYYFQQKNWAAALDQYMMLKNIGTDLNVLSRILECYSQLGKADADSLNQKLTETDIAALEAKVKANEGTAVGADLELYLLDRKLASVMRNPRTDADLATIARQYEAMLTRYPKDVLSGNNIEVYIWCQIGSAYSFGKKPDLQKAVDAYQKAVSADPTDANLYRIPAMESLALTAERAGNTNLALKVNRDLLALSEKKLQANAEDKEMQAKAVQYMKTIVTRSTSRDLVDDAIKMCLKTIEEKGQFAEMSQEARFYLGELNYQKRDYSEAAKVFSDFIKIYGPKQDEDGNFVETYKPQPGDTKADRIFESALRIAHCWYMQGHQQNMLKAYGWMVRNMSDNWRCGEAQYWLSMDAVKGRERETPVGKVRLGDTLWTNVVNTCSDITDPKYRNSFRPWVKNVEIARYVKSAILKAAQFYAEGGQHDRAARVLEQYLELYKVTSKHGRKLKSVTDEDYSETDEIAVYALGREYITIREIDKLTALYDMYVDGMRDSKFRISALKLVGHHAGTAGLVVPAADAYACLLDEYGANKMNEKGTVVPVPRDEQILRGKTGWDGVRMPPPAELDKGEIRFALGFLYWKQNAWQKCGEVLQLFVDDTALTANKSRSKALLMMGQSYDRIYDYARCMTVMKTLIRDYPKFEGVDEAYVYAAGSAMETKSWSDLEFFYKKFVKEHPASDKRPRMDLYGAVLLNGQGDTAKGMANLKALTQGDNVPEEVKADAFYHMGLQYTEAKPPKTREAADMFAQSVTTFPREDACLAAAKSFCQLKDWARAKDHLDRLSRDFPQGKQSAINEGRGMLPAVLKELAKTGNKQ